MKKIIKKIIKKLIPIIGDNEKNNPNKLHIFVIIGYYLLLLGPNNSQ